MEIVTESGHATSSSDKVAMWVVNITQHWFVASTATSHVITQFEWCFGNLFDSGLSSHFRCFVFHTLIRRLNKRIMRLLNDSYETTCEQSGCICQLRPPSSHDETPTFASCFVHKIKYIITFRFLFGNLTAVSISWPSFFACGTSKQANCI